MCPSIDKDQLFSQLPPQWPADVATEIRRLLAAVSPKIIVLDDDPTGTQTVYDVPVLTRWNLGALQSEMAVRHPAFYILTNSRSLPSADARRLYHEIGQNIAHVARTADQPPVVISRSDSTLRGHFPGEVDALVQSLQVDFDACLLIPFFPEGGRYTVANVHYVQEGQNLVPAGETEFARDASFGYRESNLGKWVAEKTNHRIPAAQVRSVSIDTIRRKGPHGVYHKLMRLPPGSICVVNAATLQDLQVFVLGLLQAEGAGKRFICRTAASFVQARIGLKPRALLSCNELQMPAAGGGLIVVGSYVPKTGAQLDFLFGRRDVIPFEVNVAKCLDSKQRKEMMAERAVAVEEALSQGRNAAIFTSRKLITGSDMQANLSIGQTVSDTLVGIVEKIGLRPRYIIAKGGITASDVATQALKIQRAMVLGQLMAGVPVWSCGPETKFPEMPYIVFPGNVGAHDSLAKAVDILRGV